MNIGIAVVAASVALGQVIGEAVMNTGTAVVALVLIAAVALIVRGMIRDKKNGKSLQCGGDCSKCGRHCG